MLKHIRRDTTFGWVLARYDDSVSHEFRYEVILEDEDGESYWYRHEDGIWFELPDGPFTTVDRQFQCRTDHVADGVNMYDGDAESINEQNEQILELLNKLREL